MLFSRMKEFQEFVDVRTQLTPETGERRFYEELWDKLDKLGVVVENSSSYRNYLVYENKLSEIQEDVSALDKISVAGYEEVYDGIKYILKSKVITLKGMIHRKKHGMSEKTLKEERYKEINNTERRGITDNNILEESSGIKNKYGTFTGDELQQIEIENKQIIEGKEYEETKMRLREINKVQSAIGDQLEMQNERIDDVCETTKGTRSTYKEINQIVFSGKGSWFKSAVYRFIIIVTVILIVMHWRSR